MHSQRLYVTYQAFVRPCFIPASGLSSSSGAGIRESTRSTSAASFFFWRPRPSVSACSPAPSPASVSPILMSEPSLSQANRLWFFVFHFLTAVLVSSCVALNRNCSCSSLMIHHFTHCIADAEVNLAIVPPSSLSSSCCITCVSVFDPCLS